MKNKKIISILIGIIVIVIVAFFMINKEREVSGRVVETSVSKDGFTYVAIKTSNGEMLGIKIPEETTIISWGRDITRDDFKSGNIGDIIIEVSYNGLPNFYQMKDGKRIKSYESDRVDIVETLIEKVYLSDNTEVEIWDRTLFGIEYRLLDGTELLSIGDDSFSIDDIRSNLEELTPKLKQDAIENIVKYYEKRGALINELSEVEKGYNEYKECDKKEDFDDDYIEESTVPMSASEDVIYMLSSYMSKGGCYNIGEAFNINTGEFIEVEDLFKCSQNKVLEKIYEIRKIENIESKKEIKNALEAGRFGMYKDCMEIYYREATYEDEEQSDLIARWIAYDEGIAEILYDWAIPKVEYELGGSVFTR